MTRIPLAILSAVLLALSYPNFNIEFFAWLALVPLFFALKRTDARQAFLLGYLTGFLFFLGVIYWLAHVTLPGMVLLSAYLALYFGLFCLVARPMICRLDSARSFRSIIPYMCIPAAWVTFEWLRSHLFTGFGWALLGYSQSFNLPAIQIADMFGAYGVSFLVALVNIGIFLIICSLRKRYFPHPPVMITIALLFAAFAYGNFRLNNIFIGEELVAGVVQGNIPQDKKWDPEFKEEILQKYTALTKALAAERPDVIIWPETSVPSYLEDDAQMVDRIKALAAEMKVCLLVGAPREDTVDADRYYNSAILFSKDGAFVTTYDKVHLVPFGEYVPFKRWLSFIERFAPSPIGDFSAGNSYTVFKFPIERRSEGRGFASRVIKMVRFSCLICFEDIFPEPSRKFVNNGAIFLVNITNDAWFGKSSAPYQHAQSSVFRAVENRVNVIRATNTGFSCFIDQKGKIVGEVRKGSERLFVDGAAAHRIVLTKTRTFYNIHGDVCAYACIMLTLFYGLYLKLVSRIDWGKQ